MSDPRQANRVSDPVASTRRRSFVRLVALVARRDYLRTVRRRGFIVGTLLLPLAIGGFITLSALFAPTAGPSPGTQIEPLALVNESSLTITPPPGSPVTLLARSEAMRRLADNRLGEFYLLPATYPEDPDVERVVAAARGPGLDQLQRQALQEQLLASVLRASLLDEEDIAPSTLERLLDPYSLTDRTADGTPAPGFQAAFLVPFGFVFLFVMSIFITSGYLLQSVTEEKENRVVEILLSSVPPLPLMSGKILGLGAAGLTQVGVWVTTGLLALPLISERLPGVSGLSISPVTLVLALAFFALGYLAYGAIFAAIGALAPGAREAQSYSGFFGFFAVIPLIFTSVFLTDLDSPIVIVLSLIPLTAPAAMLQVLALATDVPWPLVLASLLSLAAFAVLAAAAAARVFRATLLLYGVRPSLRSIVAAITARG